MRYATPLPINRTPVLTVGGPFPPFSVRHTPSDQQDPRFDCRRSVSSVLRYARPLPINMTPFRTWPIEHKAVSSVVRYARPRFHRLFRPSPPDEHDHAFHSDPAGWLPMNTTTTLFLRSDPAMYVCASRRSRPCPYVRTWPYFLSCTLATVRTCTCYVRTSTTTSAHLYIYDTCAPLHRPVCTYTFATRMTTLCTLQPGGSRLSGTSLRAKM